MTSRLACPNCLTSNPWDVQFCEACGCLMTDPWYYRRMRAFFAEVLSDD